MEFYVGCDAHRRYSVFVVMDEKGQATKPVRVEHDRGKLREFLQSLPPRSQVAIESSGGWYWLVDEIEAAGLRPQLAHSYDAKQRMAGRNKTDKFDARGLALELLTGTLPAIWIPPADVRDLRGLMRTRLALQAQSTQVKNRVSAAINRYGLKEPNENRDLFAQRHRSSLNRYIQALPAATQQATQQELALVDEISNHVGELEKQIHKQVGTLKEMRLLRTVPGIGDSGSNRPAGGWQCRPVSIGCAHGQLCRAGSSRAQLGWQDLARESSEKRESLSQMGVCRGG